jgi:hypothetical protein
VGGCLGHRALSAAACLVLGVTALPGALQAAPAGASTKAKTSPAAEIAAALVKYFDLIEAGDVDAAVALCHAEDESESLLALSLTTLRFSQGMCARAVAQQLGEQAVGESVGRPVGSKEAAASKVTGKGVNARLTLADGVSFPMVRVKGEWNLSMREIARDFKQHPHHLAVGFRQMAETYLLTARDVVDGKHETAAAVKAAMEKRGQRSAKAAPKSRGE